MKRLNRFGVSMEDELLEKFDLLITRRGYTNRSEAIRDLVREKLVDEAVHRSNTRRLELFRTSTIITSASLKAS